MTQGEGTIIDYEGSHLQHLVMGTTENEVRLFLAATAIGAPAATSPAVRTATRRLRITSGPARPTREGVAADGAELTSLQPNALLVRLCFTK